MWLWQTFKYNVSGILLWQSTYVHSVTAYPDSLQNPYNDAMSWATGYGLTRGERYGWGNGDGRFFYPPITTKTGGLADDDNEIVESLRFEILREGVEDYEYLSLLKKLLNAKKSVLSADEIQRYEDLLIIPENITKSISSYSFFVQPILERRNQIAEAIEELVQK